MIYFDLHMIAPSRLLIVLVVACALVLVVGSVGIGTSPAPETPGSAIICVDGYCPSWEETAEGVNVTVALFVQNSGDVAANVEATVGLYCGTTCVSSYLVVFNPVPGGQTVTNTTVISLPLSPAEVGDGGLDVGIDMVDAVAIA